MRVVCTIFVLCVPYLVSLIWFSEKGKHERKLNDNIIFGYIRVTAYMNQFSIERANRIQYVMMFLNLMICCLYIYSTNIIFGRDVFYRFCNICNFRSQIFFGQNKTDTSISQHVIRFCLQAKLLLIYRIWLMSIFLSSNPFDTSEFDLESINSSKFLHRCLVWAICMWVIVRVCVCLCAFCCCYFCYFCYTLKISFNNKITTSFRDFLFFLFTFLLVFLRSVACLFWFCIEKRMNECMYMASIALNK